MSEEVIWWLDAQKNSSSGGLLRFALSDGDLHFYQGNNSLYWAGISCEKQGGVFGSDKYEAYSYNSFIKIDIPSVMSEPVKDVKLYLRLWHNTGGISASSNISPDPTDAYLGVWYKTANDGKFPWVSLSTQDYGWTGWQYLTCSSENVYQLVGTACSETLPKWMAPIDITAAFNHSITNGLGSVILRFHFSKMGIYWRAPDDWNYDKRPTVTDQKCWFVICGAAYSLVDDAPTTMEETTNPPKSTSAGCPWLKTTWDSDEPEPEQPCPGETEEPTVVNCIDADTEAAMVLAGTEGGGLWVCTSENEWYKVYETYGQPITAVYMDYVRNFVNYPEEQISWFGTNNGQIYKSVDSLYNWQLSTSQTGIVNDIEGSDLDSDKVAALIGNSVYTTHNGGASWTNVKEGTDSVGNLMVRGDEIQVVFNNGTGCRSSNFGATWYDLTNLPSSSMDVGFNNFDVKNSFVGASDLYVYDSGTTNFSYVKGAEIVGDTNQIDVSHRSSIALIGTTEKVYKTINFGHEVYELKSIPAQSVAIGGLVPVEWIPLPSDKPFNAFAKIGDVWTGWLDMSGIYRPRQTYITRAINGNYYAILGTDPDGGQSSVKWEIVYSSDGGLNWSVCYEVNPTIYNPEWESDCGSCQSPYRCTPAPGFGGFNLVTDNSGNIHFFWGANWRKRRCTTSVYFTYEGGKSITGHTVLNKDHELLSQTLLYDQDIEEINRYTNVEVLRSTINSRGEAVFLYKFRDPLIPYEKVKNYGECLTCGAKFSAGNPGNDPDLGSGHINMEERWPDGDYECPSCESDNVKVYTIWPSTFEKFYRQGDVLILSGINYSMFVWQHKYGPAWGCGINYPTYRVTNNVFSNECSLVFDGNDTLHLTYTNPHNKKIYYINIPYDEIGLEDLEIGAEGFQYAMVDQYNNVHYFLNDSYRVRYSDGTWSDSELVSHNLNSSFSRSWDGTIWQLLNGDARRRRTLWASIVGVGSKSFVVSNPNLDIINHSFEDDTAVTGWSDFSIGSRSRSSARAYHGTYSLRLIGTSSTSGAARRGQINNWALPNRTVVASVWVWCAHSNRARIQVLDRSSDGDWEETTSSYHPGDGSWHQLSVTRQVREDTNQIAVVCRVEEGSNVEAFFDLVTASCINPLSELSNDDTIQVHSSSGNDGDYKVNSYNYNSSTGQATIEVFENVPSDVVDGKIIPIRSSVPLCGIWDIYASRSYSDGTKTSLVHSYYPVDYEGAHSCIFEEGFAGTIRASRAVYFWSDPPEDQSEIKLLTEGKR